MMKQEARMTMGQASLVLHINHGATAGTDRPTTKSDVIVLWIGSVEPTNAENNDLWVDTS